MRVREELRPTGPGRFRTSSSSPPSAATSSPASASGGPGRQEEGLRGDGRSRSQEADRVWALGPGDTNQRHPLREVAQPPAPPTARGEDCDDEDVDDDEKDYDNEADDEDVDDDEEDD